MIFVHETHEVRGGKMAEFGDAVRMRWRPLLEERGDARLFWFWELAHGTNVSYQAISLTAVRDWAAWGGLVARLQTDPRARDWQREVWTLRHELTAKLLLPTAWSPLQDIDLAHAPAEVAGSAPALYLHDTGWPFSGKREEYVDALGRLFAPQTSHARMISVIGCWTVAPGTGRHHEVVLLQRIEDWDAFARLLAHGEQGAQRSGWMVEGLRYRERWESKLLRCVGWSPRQ